MTLLTSIVQLSYEGDVRVGLAEDPRKVQNIVNAQRDALWGIYQPLASDLEVDVPATVPTADLCATNVSFDNSSAGRRKLFLELPLPVQQSVVALAAGNDPWMQPEALRSTLRSTVRRASLQQAAKGVLSSGVARSLRYALAKVGKRLK
eukprot:gb/GFBE01073963.1/.p1 GENE.gb/GFBE01073963.1/~~gb/GFBE01073963.1/.p1  ORF type:complete len:149 (+),score=29.63 gb/GFBE01073963.1/:1-447(+)